MREIYCKDEVVFRGGIQSWEDEETTLKENTSGTEHHISGLRLRTWLIGILGFLLASLIFVNSFIIGQFRITHLISAAAIQTNIIDTQPTLLSEKVSGYLVHNEGCRIAALDPFDPVSRRYIHKEKPIECETGNQLPLIESNDTAIYVNPAAQYQYYNVSEVPSCCWSTFTREAGQDNSVTYESLCHRFQYSAIIDAEFIKVECYQEDNKKIYRDYHAFVPQKNKTEERCRVNREKKTSATSGKFLKEGQEHLSLLVVGLDSVSRLNFHRMMPSTVKTLKNLGAIELLGYNKVGDNTYPNLVPVLSGLSSSELKAKCLRKKRSPFDDCPFLWKNFSEAGYRTIFAEDACSMTTFNYLKPGFRDPPTDYYLRPYCIAAEGDIGNNHKMNSNLCLGARKNFENLLNYTTKVARKFANDRYFAFFWQASLTHDFFNYPQLGDDAHSSFFGLLGHENLLKNTALVVMSDHGMRWGDYRETYQGRMEGSLPFVFFVFPAWWQEKYRTAMGNLRKNIASLSTPYDLHETFIDIQDTERISERSIASRNSRIFNRGNVTRGISLFLSIPSNRTCAMAGIPENWCMCHTSTGIPTNDTNVRNASGYLVDELNKLFKNYPQCSPLTLRKVMSAQIWIGRDNNPSNYSNNDNNNNIGNEGEKNDYKIAPWIDYTVAIETEPGGAIFEASIRHNDTSNKLVGTISRLNPYGTQSACVDDFNMRLYCYCY